MRKRARKSIHDHSYLLFALFLSTVRRKNKADLTWCDLTQRHQLMFSKKKQTEKNDAIRCNPDKNVRAAMREIYSIILKKAKGVLK